MTRTEYTLCFAYYFLFFFTAQVFCVSCDAAAEPVEPTYGEGTAPAANTDPNEHVQSLEKQLSAKSQESVDALISWFEIIESVDRATYELGLKILLDKWLEAKSGCATLSLPVSEKDIEHLRKKRNAGAVLGLLPTPWVIGNNKETALEKPWKIGNNTLTPQYREALFDLLACPSINENIGSLTPADSDAAADPERFRVLRRVIENAAANAVGRFRSTKKMPDDTCNDVNEIARQRFKLADEYKSRYALRSLMLGSYAKIDFLLSKKSDGYCKSDHNEIHKELGDLLETLNKPFEKNGFQESLDGWRWVNDVTFQKIMTLILLHDFPKANNLVTKFRNSAEMLKRPSTNSIYRDKSDNLRASDSARDLIENALKGPYSSLNPFSDQVHVWKFIASDSGVKKSKLFNMLSLADQLESVIGQARSYNDNKLSNLNKGHANECELQHGQKTEIDNLRRYFCFVTSVTNDIVRNDFVISFGTYDDEFNARSLKKIRCRQMEESESFDPMPKECPIEIKSSEAAHEVLIENVPEDRIPDYKNIFKKKNISLFSISRPKIMPFL